MAVSLVTGGAGFIGAHVTNELVSMGHKVVVLDDLSGGFITGFSMNISSTMSTTWQPMQPKVLVILLKNSIIPIT